MAKSLNETIRNSHSSNFAGQFLLAKEYATKTNWWLWNIKFGVNIKSIANG